MTDDLLILFDIPLAMRWLFLKYIIICY